MATMFTNQEFEENPSAARDATARGPVFIGEDGRPTYVLLTVEVYQQLIGSHLGLAEALAQPDTDFDFDPPKFGHSTFKPADFG